jgi:uncharacterized protein (TIGR03437 family)
MSSHLSLLLTLSLSCAVADAAALVPVPIPLQPALPVVGLEANQGQATAGILFLIPGISSSMAVTAQSVLYSPIGATLSLMASNPNPVVSFSDPLPGLVNSYTGSNPQKWVTGIPRYGTATLTAVYPGINAQYTVSSNGLLTLNLMLAAGVNPNVMTFQIAQASKIALNADGSLFASITSPDVLVPPGPSLSYAAPVASQSTASGQVSRTVSFVVQSTTAFGLAVQGLDTAEALQISIQIGGSGLNLNPSGFGLVSGSNPSASDAAGDTFFATTVADPAGKTAPFPTIGGDGCGNEIDRPYPCSDVAVYKFSAAGVLDFITYLAGRTMDSPGFVGLAPGGALMVAGTTDSSGFPVTAAAAQTVYAGPPAAPGAGSGMVSGDYFAAILNPDTGALESSTYLGGPDADTMQTAAIGADGSLYFLPTGVASAEMPVTSGALQSSCPGSPCLNGYVAHLSPALDKLLYGTYVPGAPQTTAQLYSDGSVYYAGTAEAGFPTTPGAYQPQNAGGYDGIIARLDPTGTHLVFGTYYGTPNTDWTLAMALAPDGSVWANVYSFVQCCVTGQYELIHLTANGETLLANLPLNVSEMVVNPAGDLFTLASGNITVSPSALLAVPCGVNGNANPGTAAYVELSPTGQQLFATYLPVGIGGFDGADAQGTPYLDTVNNMGVVSGRVQVVQNQSSGPFAGCVVDAADFGNEQIVSPGGIVTIFGSQMGPSTGVAYQLLNGQVPTTLGGTQVLVNGEPAPILYSSSDQLNLILPYSLEEGTTPTIQVVSNDTPANEIFASVIPQGISIFQANGSAAALNQDGTLNSAQNPAQPGSVVMLFGTGGGQTNPPSVAGEVTPLVLRPLVQTPSFMISYVAVLNVEWAGAAPGLLSGVTQINVQLPNVIPVVQGYPQGVLPLQVSEGGFSGGATIYAAVN